MKAVRYRNASGEHRIGRLEDESIVDAGPAGEQGFVPTREAWDASWRPPTGQRSPLDAVSLAHPVVPRKLICIGLNYRDHAEESELDIPDVPVIFAKWTTSLIGHGETIVIPREETRPDYEGELAIVIGERVVRATRRRRALGGRRLHLLPRRLRPPRAARDAAAPVHVRQELRHVRAARVRASSTPRASTSARSQVTTVVSGETMQDSNTQQPDLRHRGARRVRLARDDARARRRDRDRHARRRRRLAQSEALPARGRRRRHHRRPAWARSAIR